MEFVESQRLTNMETHNKDKHFVCNICNKLLKSNDFLVSHLDSHKLIEVGSYSKCHQCDKMFDTENKAKRHLETHKPRMDVQCEFCKKRYKNKDSLRRHTIKMHIICIPSYQ